MPSRSPRPPAIFVILICLIAPIYANTLHAPWQFDDFPNIVDNQRLHLDSIEPETIRRTFFARAGRDAFFRPLPNLSFALNWLAGKDDTAGYHIVNISLHILTAFFLYLTLSRMFKTPALNRRFSADEAAFISLLGTVLWAANPIQTQAVTYIVQRMALMAALFYIAGMFFYLKARLSSARCGRWYWALAGLMFLGGVFSKENAILFPAALFLLEILFFDGATVSVIRRRIVLWGCSILAVGIIGAVIFTNGNILFFMDDYQCRPFTLSERVLTQPRIILLYLSQIFYPLPFRLSVAHDVLLSKSLFQPWTTVVAVVLVGLLIILSVSGRRRFPLFSFAVLFFFVNHAVESSIIPLELIFEHRNYLPSFFLFAPVAGGVHFLIRSYQRKNRFVSYALAGCVVAVVIACGRFTWERNRVWLSAESLWYDAMLKAPHQSGPVNNTAVALAWGRSSSSEKKRLAIRMLERAIGLEQPHTMFVARIYDNIGGIRTELGEFDQAEEAYRKAIALDSDFLKARYNLARALAQATRWESALAAADELLAVSGNQAREKYHVLKGFIHLWLNQPDRALPSFQLSLLQDPYNAPATLLYTGCALSRAGEFDRAEWFYKLAQAGQPLQPLTFFLLVENSVRAGKQADAERYARILFSEFDVYDILTTLKRLPEPGRTAPLDKGLVTPVIQTVFQAIGREAQDKGILPQ